MIILYLIILVFLLFLYIKSNNKKQIFSKAIAEYLYDNKPQFFVKKQMREEIQMLSAGVKKDIAIKNYVVEKLSLTILILCVASFLAVLLTLSNLNKENLLEGKEMIRNDHGEGKKEIILSTSVDKQQIKIPITIEEQKYTEQELETLYSQYIEELEKAALGENESVEKIQKDMKLLPYLPGYPFQNQWECSDYNILSSDGSIKEDVDSAEGVLVKLTVFINYFEWKREYSFFVNVFEKELPTVQMIEKKLKKEIAKNDIENKQEKFVPLPISVEGRSLQWEEQRNNQPTVLFFLGIAAAICTYFFKEKEIVKQIKERQEEMLNDYPEIISKLTLFMGAGMSVRKTIEKLTSEYLNQKKGGRRYAYEELNILYQEMERGISEIQAYENFGKRCKIPVYMKLGTLLAQNVKKGNSSLLKMLQKEVQDAFEERKNRAKKKGEEAGTKLLLPMILMLLVVMIIVIVPAFFSFQI